MFSDRLLARAEQLLDLMRARKLMVATAESCTGGLIAGLLTEISGSSDVVDRGFVTYSNAAKTAMLGVPAATLDRHGAVSEETARAMAEGALAHSKSDIAVAVTGVAGPTGGSLEKPVGLVHIAVARRGRATDHQACRFGAIDRRAIRLATVDQALAMLEASAATGEI